MERSIQLLFTGGILAVAGLWAIQFAESSSTVWYGGIGVVVVAAVLLAAGLAADLRTGPGPR